MDTLKELFESEIKDIYSAEKQLAATLPKMAKFATTATLKDAFTTHLAETKVQIERLEKLCADLSFKPTGKKCAAMEGLVKEGKEILDEEEPGVVTDAALIGAAQRCEHYEMAAYGTVRAMAKVLGYTEAMQTLTLTLSEETATDKKLSKISEKDVLPHADMGEDEEDEEADEEASE